ncbi:BhlA/UviB family holin-like peptide [Clostridium celatum]|uniref:BhlA/UviB family holin-like peptide n=1 Tax=Clostridium celatum TaxID=36834 RepID=UPI001897B4AE|nr:BhlA/UviB family holin-like peptide [Clostridium celatum]
MSETVVNAALEQGIWVLLSFLLISYILKAQEKRDIKQDEREKNYQNIITQLTTKFEDIYSEIRDIKDILKK